MLILATFATLSSLALVHSAHAAGATPDSVDTYLENKKGVKAYQEGKMDEARQHFGSAQALNPTLPELQYNQGLMQLQEGKTDEAIQGFKDSARGSMRTGNRRLLGRSLFNLGTALTKKGDVGSAIRSYLGALNSANQAGDTALAEDARKNLELLIQQQQKQKQQSKQDQQKQQPPPQQQQQPQQQKQGSPSNQSNPSGGPKPDQSKDQGKDQDQGKPDSQPNQTPQYSNESQQKNFKSKKLSEDDAERVIDELKNKEQELQARRQKQRSGYGTHAQPTNVEDW